MQNVNLNTLIPSIVALVVFVANSCGKPVDQMSVTQVVTAVVSLVGVIIGIFSSHRKQSAQQNVETPLQPPSAP